jgi:hypothetical protein
MSRTADISFTGDATEPAEQFFVMLIGWDMTVFPEDGNPFNGHLISISGTKKDGQLKGLWERVDETGTPVPDEPQIELDLYDELDRVEIY